MSAQVDVLAVLDDYSAQHGDPDDFVQARAAVAALIAERDALREDASRYRFLRDRMAVEDMPEEHPSWSTPSEEESRKFDAAVDAALARAQPAPVVEAGGWIAADDVRRLTREIDVALNGEAGAAPQASLCDIAAQAKAEASKRGAPLLAAPVVDDADATEILALSLDEFGYHTEARNVRAGEDLDEYRVEMWAIRAAIARAQAGAK